MLRCDVMRPDGGKKESPTVTPFRVISSRQERNCCQTAPKYSNGGSAGRRLNSPAVGCCVHCRFGKLLSGGALAEPWQAASEALSLGTKDYLHPHWFSPAMSTHALVASGKEKEALLPAASPPSPLLSSCFSIWSIFWFLCHKASSGTLPQKRWESFQCNLCVLHSMLSANGPQLTISTWSSLFLYTYPAILLKTRCCC